MCQKTFNGMSEETVKKITKTWIDNCHRCKKRKSESEGGNDKKKIKIITLEVSI